MIGAVPPHPLHVHETTLPVLFVLILKSENLTLSLPFTMSVNVKQCWNFGKMLVVWQGSCV